MGWLKPEKQEESGLTKYTQQLSHRDRLLEAESTATKFFFFFLIILWSKVTSHHFLVANLSSNFKSSHLNILCFLQTLLFTTYAFKIHLFILTCSPISLSQSEGWSWGRCAAKVRGLWWPSGSSDEVGTQVGSRGWWCSRHHWHLNSHRIV